LGNSHTLHWRAALAIVQACYFDQSASRCLSPILEIEICRKTAVAIELRRLIRQIVARTPACTFPTSQQPFGIGSGFSIVLESVRLRQEKLVRSAQRSESHLPKTHRTVHLRTPTETVAWAPCLYMP
jgi:hypothetical protein